MLPTAPSPRLPGSLGSGAVEGRRAPGRFVAAGWGSVRIRSAGCPLRDGRVLPYMRPGSRGRRLRKPRARDCRSVDFPRQDVWHPSPTPARVLRGYFGPYSLPLHLAAVIDIQSRTNATSLSLVRHRAGKNTANAAHNTAERNQCAASDIGVSQTAFSAPASVASARQEELRAVRAISRTTARSAR